jgi:hypothetical protein
MSEFFSGSKPDLISMKSINELTATVFVLSSQDIPTTGIVNNPNNVNNINILRNPLNIKTFFVNYIKPNLLPVIIILIFIGFLVFRYFSKDESNQYNSKSNSNQINQSNFNQINQYNSNSKSNSNQLNKTINNINSCREDFNPSIPITLQSDKMEYPTAGYRPPKYPDDKDLEISIDEVFEKMKKKHGPRYDDVPTQDYCVFENPEHRESIYYGNTSWINQPDGAKNVVYNENNLVSSTGNFVQYGIEKNLDEMARKIFD